MRIKLIKIIGVLFVFFIVFVGCKKEPVVVTGTITSVTDNSAICEGIISDNGGASITAKGVCWSTSQNPTITDDHTTDGTGTGTFTSNITGLTDNTTYYVRAYATNSIGTSYGEQKTFTTNEIEIEMIYVAGGSFQMGCGTGQSGCGSDETPVHTVTIDDFYIGKYEVTQAQYEAVMGTNPAHDYGVGDNYPVYYVSWYDAVEFCNALSQMEGLNNYYNINGTTVTTNTGANGYRLPTEAEWEYAARGGQSYTDYYLYSGSDNIDDVAWWDDNSGSSTHEVGTKDPNQLGIYDMSGNLYEWCWDWWDYDYYSSSPSSNPQGPASGSYRVLRGGYWNVNATCCRVAYRYSGTPSGSNLNSGFRISKAN